MKRKLTTEEHDEQLHKLKQKRKKILTALDKCEEKIQHHSSYGKYVMPKLWHTVCIGRDNFAANREDFNMIRDYLHISSDIKFCEDRPNKRYFGFYRNDKGVFLLEAKDDCNIAYESVKIPIKFWAETIIPQNISVL